jgi:hypothetical protein
VGVHISWGVFWDFCGVMPDCALSIKVLYIIETCANNPTNLFHVLLPQELSEKVSTIRAKIEPTLVAVLMAEHPSLGRNSVIPTDTVTLIARQIHKDVSNYLNTFINNNDLNLKSHAVIARAYGGTNRRAALQTAGF